MKLIGLIFALLAYSVLKFMIIGDVAGQPQPDPPEIPDFTDCGLDDCEFRTFNPGCGSIEGCLEDIGDALWNLGLFVVFLFTTIFKVFLFIAQIAIFITQIAIEPIEEAPWYINVLLYTPITFLIALLIFKLATRGEDE